MENFYQRRGRIGPVFSPAGVTFKPTANPYVGKNWTPQPLGQSNVQPAQTTTATIAGRAAIGCCGSCSHDYRNK